MTSTTAHLRNLCLFLLVLGLSGCRARSFPLNAVIRGQLEPITKTSDTNLGSQVYVSLKIRYENAGIQDEKTIDLGSASADAGGKFSINVQEKFSLYRALWNKIDDQIQIVYYEVILSVGGQKIIGQAKPFKPSYQQLIDHPDSLEQFVFNFPIELATLRVSETIRNAQSMASDSNRDQVLMRFLETYLLELGPMSVLQLTQNMAFDSSKNSSLLKYARAHYATLNVNEALRLGIATPSDSTKDTVLMEFASSQAKRLTDLDLRRLSQSTAFDSSRDSILKLTLSR